VWARPYSSTLLSRPRSLSRPARECFHKVSLRQALSNSWRSPAFYLSPLAVISDSPRVTARSERVRRPVLHGLIRRVRNAPPTQGIPIRGIAPPDQGTPPRARAHAVTSGPDRTPLTGLFLRTIRQAHHPGRTRVVETFRRPAFRLGKLVGTTTLSRAPPQALNRQTLGLSGRR
jgi:hypothetical protein